MISIEISVIPYQVKNM